MKHITCNIKFEANNFKFFCNNSPFVKGGLEGDFYNNLKI